MDAPAAKKNESELAQSSVPSYDDVPLTKYTEIDTMMHNALHALEADNHISTQYPSMWKKRSQCCPRPFALAMIILMPIVLAIHLWLLVEVERDYKTSSSQDRFEATVVTGVLAAIFAALMLCSVLPQEYMFVTSFNGLLFFHLGAALGMAASIGEATGREARFLRVAGSFALAVGAGTWALVNFVVQSPLVMVGSAFVFLGALSWYCETITRQWFARPIGDHDTDIANVMGMVAASLLLIALCCLGIESYNNMTKPYLGSTNYFGFGSLMFTATVGCALTSSIKRLSDCDDVDDTCGYDAIDRVGTSLLWLSSALYLLASARAKDAIDAVIEHRYPAVIKTINEVFELQLVWFASSIGGLAAIVAMLAQLTESSLWSHTTASRVVVVAHCVLAFAMLALSFAWSQSRYPGRFLLVVGSLLLGVACATDAIAREIDADNQEIMVVSCIAGVLGGCGIISAAARLAIVPVGLTPASWLKLLHPGNYLLQAGVILVIGFGLKLGGNVAALYHNDHDSSTRGVGHAFDRFAEVATVWFFILLVFHNSMSNHCWSATHTRTPKRKGPQTQPPASKPIEFASFDDAALRLGVRDKETAAAVGTPKQEEARVNSQRPTAHEEVKVVVVGSGISGLMLACQLGKANVETIVIEKRKTQITDARFLLMNCATMEHVADVLDADLLSELRTRALSFGTPFGSMLCTGLDHADAEILVTANTPAAKTLFEDTTKLDKATECRSCSSRFSSQIPVRAMQSLQEYMLLKQAKRLTSVQIRYGNEFKSCEMNSSTTVTMRVQPVDADVDKTYSITASYIVGADGPSSSVADAIGIKYDGVMNLATVGGMLVKAPGLHSRVIKKMGGTHQYQVIRKNFGVAFVVPVDSARDLWNIPVFMGPNARKALQEGNHRQVIAEFLGTENFEIQYSGKWHWNFFVAQQFRKGSAFLIGDAAHSWPPFAGLGGNSGYGDAVNLGWKLAAACNGWGSDHLLDSYNAERRQAIIQTAMYVLRATPQPKNLNRLISPFFDTMLTRQWLKSLWYFRSSGVHSANHFAQSGIQLGVKYNHSGVVVQDGNYLPEDSSCVYTPMVSAGARLPFCRFADTETDGVVEQQTSFSVLSLHTYTLLEFADADSDGVDVPPQRRQSVKTSSVTLQEAFANRNTPLHCVSAKLAKTPADASQSVRKVMSLFKDVEVIIVRPDHTVAWCKHSAKSVFSTSSTTPPLDATIADAVVTLLVGRDGDGVSISSNHTEAAKLQENYLQWLRKEFLHNLRPFFSRTIVVRRLQFRFPNAITIKAQTKADAIATAKSKVSPDKAANIQVLTKLADIPNDHDVKTQNEELERRRSLGVRVSVL
eukprot:m.61696 g.61696  ORF g.61696 m.61696 type:complete len:1341 (+) comp23019_c0_seq2:150-4172(+)